VIFFRLFFSAYFIFSAFFLFSQVSVSDDICEFPDVFPVNKGGLTELNRLIHDHLIYPDKPFKSNQEAQVKLGFVVMKEGSVTGEKILVSGGKEFDDEAMRLLHLLEWIPGQKNSVKVISRGTITITFNLAAYKKSIKDRGFSKPRPDKKFPFDSTFMVIENPETQAEYFRGSEALTEFIQENLEYPDMAKRQNLQGIVQMSFVVETNGKTSNIFVEKSVGGGCAEEAVGLIGQTKWKPAIHNGKIVRSRYHYSIAFTLNNDYRSNELGEQK
jgi:TonB family protein